MDTREHTLILEYDDERLEFICVYRGDKLIRAYKVVEKKRIPIKSFSFTVSTKV